MAYRLIAQGNVVAVCDQRLISLADSERHKVISLAAKGGGEGARHGRNHALQVVRCQRDLSDAGKAYAVWCLRNLRLPNYFRSRLGDGLGGLRHERYCSVAAWGAA